jgi:hypothetical protein
VIVVEEKAVIDRIEDDRLAVLLVGDDERELIVAMDRLPADAKAGSWLRVQLEDDQLIDAQIDEAQTQAVMQRISDKLALLRQRGRSLRPE